MKLSFLKFSPVALLPLIVISVWMSYHYRQALKSTPLPYEVIADGMGTSMSIGMSSNASEQQLIATLVRAADDHQYDAARDLLLSSYFSVTAYLMENGKRSTLPAGKITRYVPAKHSRSRDWMDWLSALYGNHDKLNLTLESARSDLRKRLTAP